MLKTPSKLESDRLIVKPLVIKDVKRIFSVYASHPEATRYISWPTHKTVNETMTFLVNKLKKHNDEEHIHGIFRKFDEQFIGSVVLKKFERSG